ncbi:acylpeptide hydrolase [Nesidiocoris tenuis]|uniref:acylaminoacyl-peptidase n=1 Tax=Nesidiocoris tenuis TaxID=355587 RepID=A0ABN7AYV8_9HEMI|nr:acylpeptide hydrolase [Nesidiocoris tenuis]
MCHAGSLATIYENYPVEFGCLQWSSSEEKILYTAEKKKPKSEPFLPTPIKPSEDLSYGDKYVMVEDWGETLPGKSQPVLVVWDWAAGTISELAASPELISNFSLGQGVWAADGSVVCIGWDTRPRRLGKVFCTNRLSSIFRINQDGSHETIWGGNRSVRSVRFSPDGKNLVWLERETFGPHHACMKLMKMSWPPKKDENSSCSAETVVDIVDKSILTANGEPFFGIYSTDLGNFWLNDNKTIVISTSQRASIRSYAIDIDSSQITDITGCSADDETFSLEVLDVKNDYILASRSSLGRLPSLVLKHVKSSDWIVLVKPEETVPSPVIDIVRLKSTVKPEVADEFSAIFCCPKDKKDVPLIVFPHGGPNSASTNISSPLTAFFNKLGFAVLFVNYRGSAGAGEASIKSLEGNVGTVDVMDCHQSALHLLEKYSSVLNRDKVLLFGGSHGGFLVLHLAGQFPETFRCTVALNPVVDLTGFGSSDIPDWVFAQIGEPYGFEKQIEVDSFVRMKSMSPIFYINRVKAPVLLLIGKNDLRVPPSQGINYYYALKARSVPTKLLLYEDNHGLRETPHTVDFAINTILWFLETIDYKFQQ